MSAGAQPISPEEAEGLFSPFSDRHGVVLAVSGGIDSTAMMALAAAWARQRAAPRLFVATVDHGLRPESAAEAALVGRLAEELGLSHAVLRWTEPKPRSGLQEAARDARYDLLADYARAVGADAIATAHHADDQAETVLMRLVRGSGPAGLAGMAAAAWKGDIAHLRPLLGTPKARLAATVEALRLPHCDDPSNRSDRFTRNRMRRLLAALEPEGLDRERLLTLARRAARAEDALAAAASGAYDRFVADVGTGLATQPGLADEPLEIRIRVLLRAVERLNPSRRPLRLARAEALAEKLAVAAASGGSCRATFGGCVVSLERDGSWRITIEKPRRRGAFRQA